MKRPGLTDGMRHVALFVERFSECEQFYTDLLGMEVEWRPDEDNVYRTSGRDNLALHRADGKRDQGQLDHIGFFINDILKIDAWYEFLSGHGVVMLTDPRTHRDGARSFYCLDPSGIKVQMIYHNPIAESENQTR